VHRAVPLPRTDRPGPCPQALRERWRLAALAAGWPFPSDWGVPAVDAVCEAAAEGRDPAHALSLLGQARAESGAGLDETLCDLAALYTVVRAIGCDDPAPEQDPTGVDAVPTGLVRATALGWADVAAGELASARPVDELTGLATAGYLRVRLGEVYAHAGSAGGRVDDAYVLVMLALDLSRTGGWSRLVPMLLAAEAMRSVFDSGETLALAGPSVAVALARRDELLALRTKRLRRVATARLATDSDAARAGPVRVWVERLPAGYQDACDLLGHLGR
jgi:hypothetical protein